jgi:hypothetical protein
MTGKINVLSGNTLKILAAIFMVFDHVGVLLYPDVLWLRIVGRLSFPIFAFMIAEGAKYTKSKVRYFLSLSVLALICQLVYYFFDGGSLYMCILVTFSISILLIYLLQFVKKTFFDESKKAYVKMLALLSFFAATVAVYLINTNDFSEKTGIVIDYGFAGVMVPVFASLFDFGDLNAPQSLKKLDIIPVRVLSMSIGLLLLVYELSLANVPSLSSVQIFSLLAVPLLLLYSGKRGRFKMKWFFYVFYPLHLVAIYAIYYVMLIKLGYI